MLNTKSNMLTLCSGKCADLGPCTMQKVVPYQLSSAYTVLSFGGFFTGKTRTLKTIHQQQECSLKDSLCKQSKLR